MDAPVLIVAFVALAAGFGQFGVIASLGDVARSFGRITHGATIADQAGLSGTQLGIGLAVVRLASLGGLPLSGLADRVGRRRTLLTACALGLALTVVAAASPGYWWFIGIFALGRPFLSASVSVAQVSAAEQTASRDRAKAVALIAAAYGVGAGLTAIIHSLSSDTLGFRGIFALAAVPLALLFVARHRVVESDRFAVASAARERPFPVLGPVEGPFRRRLLIVVGVAFAIAVVTGPANSFLFIYAQNVIHLSGGTTAVMVVAAGFTGLLGLLAGRSLADNIGRRGTAALGMVGVAGFGVLAYSGSRIGLLIGYTIGVFAGSTFAPAAGALANELFPTSVRASAAGWQVAAAVLGAVAGLLAFGAVADVGNHFGLAALIVFPLTVPATALFWLVPETKGREPEEVSPERS
jgi:MFS family permease